VIKVESAQADIKNIIRDIFYIGVLLCKTPTKTLETAASLLQEKHHP